MPEPEIQTLQIIIPKENPFDYEDESLEYEASFQQENTEQNTPAATQSKTGLSLRLKEDD